MRHLRRLNRPGRLAVVVAGAVLLGGCAERAVVAAPATRPGAGTWVAVWLAGALAAVVLGVLLTLPCWTDRRASGGSGASRGPRFVAGLLALQTGAAAVVGMLLVGYALRSWQLVERGLDEPPATALVRISRIDGDGALFALIVLTLVLLGGLAVAVLAMAARMAVSADPLERWVLVAFLGVEVLGASVLAVAHLVGFGGWPFRSGLVALPVLIAAFVAAWPRNELA